MVKEAIGEGAAELFMEEHEQEGDLGSFLGEPVGIAFAVAFQQSVRFQFAEIVAKLIESVSVGSDSEGSKHGGVDVFCSPDTHRCAAVQQISIRRIMRVSWILMPGNFALPTVMGKARRCRSGKST